MKNKKRLSISMVNAGRGDPTFCVAGRKQSQKLGGHKNVSKKAWQAKFNIVKHNNRASLTLSIPLSTIIAPNHTKCNSNSYNCVLSYQVLDNS